MRRITAQHLATCGLSGRFAVGELLHDYEQYGCITVPAGTRFVAKAVRGNEVVALFPHDTPGLEAEERVFIDGHIRVLCLRHFKVVGRIGG